MDKKILKDMIQAFKKQYKYKEQKQQSMYTFFSPGRVNIIGEHIDYNGGYVFPCALDFGTYAVVTVRKDRKVRFSSMNMEHRTTVDLDQLQYDKKDGWTNYPKGVIKMLEEFTGIASVGFDVLYYGNIPNGSGLSSSASLEVLTGVIVRKINQLDVSMLDICKLSMKAENEFVGLNCGIMDQFAVGMGKPDMAMLLDCNSLDYEYIPFHLQGVKIVIGNTKKKRGLADSKYNQRRSECEAALADLNQTLAIKNLCDLTPAEFDRHRHLIHDPIAARRAQHAVYENARVMDCVAALRQNDLATVGRLLVESHQSLRDLYDVTGIELDTMVDEALQIDGTIGARMTGAGFGGCIVALVREEAVERFIDQVGKNYQAKVQIEPEFYVAGVGQGATEVLLDRQDRTGYWIEQLIYYGLAKNLIQPVDTALVRNRLMEVMGVSRPYRTEPMSDIHSLTILKELTDIAVEQSLIEDSIVERDLWDARLMGEITPWPSQIVQNYQAIQSGLGKIAATDYFYQISQDSNYIRTDRIAKNIYWTSFTPYGELEITVNMSKPEKDPKAIAKAKLLPAVDYPKCLLCLENVGYQGRINHPGRSNHRVLPLTLDREQWYLQYSPYVYYNEHSIIFSEHHRPMQIQEATFVRLLDFVEQFPHYFIGSNADLPIVGGSILSHDHFQAGRHQFAMEKAPLIAIYQSPIYRHTKIGMVKWPLSVIRISGRQKSELIELSTFILDKWRNYSDKNLGVLARSGGQPHNTITPIARINRYEEFEIDLVLRNNRTTEQYPDGIFHPHQPLHHIKKENIGLIEVMGLAILPARLQYELNQVQAVLTGQKQGADLETAMDKHQDWISSLIKQYGIANSVSAAEQIIQAEVGAKFTQVLECAGVFKQDPAGNKGLGKFIHTIL